STSLWTPHRGIVCISERIVRVSHGSLVLVCRAERIYRRRPRGEWIIRIDFGSFIVVLFRETRRCTKQVITSIRERIIGIHDESLIIILYGAIGRAKRIVRGREWVSLRSERIRGVRSTHWSLILLLRG